MHVGRAKGLCKQVPRSALTLRSRGPLLRVISSMGVVHYLLGR